MKKSIFKETFKQQDEMLIGTANSASTPTNQRIETSLAEITKKEKKNEKQVNFSNEIGEVQLTTDASQEIVNENLKN